MDEFMHYDFNINKIVLAILVPAGAGDATHKNRKSHGLAIHKDGDKIYTFSDGRKLQVKENDIIYLPKHSNYTVKTKEVGDCYAINFDISENVDSEPFSFKLKNAPAFIKEFEKATELWRNRNTSFHMQCKSILYNILSMMQNEYNSKYIARSTANLIAPAIEYIKKNYTNENISVPELSLMCDISEDYFRKIFKSTFGVTPRKYINEMKISYAKELVSSGIYTITEAAELSGYTDMSYFSREFKKVFGVCPAEYKKRV